MNVNQACPHPVANHRHGTYPCYVQDRCRCRHCSKAMAAYDRQRRRNIAYGRANLVDVEPVRKHTLRLLESGLGTRQIARLAGLRRSVVIAIAGRHGQTVRRVTRNTEAKILALQPHMVSEWVRVDATGTRRRLQALIALGWSRRQLCEHMGVSYKALYAMLREGRVTLRNTRLAREVFERLSMTLPPDDTTARRHSIQVARGMARYYGWAPPLAWDDDDIDDPDGRPNGFHLRGGYNRDLFEVVQHHHRLGLNDVEIAHLLGRTKNQVALIRNTLGLPPNTRRGWT